MRTIGLTGGIATGKSTVADLLRNTHGLPVLDADIIAREVVMPGSPAHKEIRNIFGPDVFLEDGALNRVALRALIVEDATARASLEAITHPKILARILEELVLLSQAGRSVAFVEAALLVETGSYAAYDGLWVVTCSAQLQLERLMARDSCTKTEALSMIATQLPLSEKEALADSVIGNSGSLEQLKTGVSRALSHLHS